MLNVPVLMADGLSLVQPSASAIHLQPIPREPHTRREFRLRFVMIVIMREMREISSIRTDATRGGQRFVQAHVCGVRRKSQRVQHGDLHTAHLFEHSFGHFLAIIQIREPLFSVLREQITERDESSVRQWQWSYLQITQRELPGDDALLRLEITSRPRPVVERVLEHTPQIGHRFEVRIDRQRVSTAQVAEPAAIIQPHDVIRVTVREDDGVHLADVFAETLHPQIGRSIHEEAGLLRGDVDG